MRYLLGTPLLLVILAACTTTQPNDAGQYFDRITPDPASLEGKVQENQLAQAEGQPVTVQASTQTATGVIRKKTKKTTEGDGSISDSQDFKAVTARETIESDAIKLQELKDNYEIVKPGTAPRRGSGINLAKYALSQNNPVGQRLYKRIPFGGLRSKRRCANYISPDEAQIDFLKSGGPKSDRRGVDPDGDGYACNWTPAIYRSMLGQ